MTGLPSTPSRNPIVQPQARRACVNPFNRLKRFYYSLTGGPATVGVWTAALKGGGDRQP